MFINIFVFFCMIVVGLNIISRGIKFFAGSYKANYNHNNMNEEIVIDQNEQFNQEMMRQQTDQLNQEMFRQQTEQFDQEMLREQEQQGQYVMDESLKNVTPFEMGGYDMNQGNSFNDFNNGMF